MLYKHEAIYQTITLMTFNYFQLVLCIINLLQVLNKHCTLSAVDKCAKLFFHSVRSITEIIVTAEFGGKANIENVK